MFSWHTAFILTKWILIAGVGVKILAKLSMGWCRSNTCLTGKTVIVTGGNSGLGYQTALVLAGRGARVIIADRNDSTESVKKIITSTKNPNVISKFIDLSSLDSIRQFAKEINDDEDRLDILVNNAGVGAVSDSYTRDGLQIQIQVNHFGPFLLTHLLIDLLKKSAPSRIIFLSSIAAFFDNLSMETINSTSGHPVAVINYFQTYANTKLLNLITSNGFAEKLKGTGVTCNAVHPGLVVTSIYDKLLGPSTNKLVVLLSYAYLRLIGKDAYEGAQTQINCALSERLKTTTGEYFVDCKPFYQPTKARNREFCRNIWRRSEELVKLEKAERINLGLGYRY